MDPSFSRRVTRVLFSFVLISALILTSAVQAFAAEQEQVQPGVPLNEETAAAFLDEFFSSEIASMLNIGAAVTIVKDGETLVQRGYGFANLEEMSEVDPQETVFRIASVSKTFTAVAVMQLAEQGKLDLEEDILTYLPDLELDNPFDKPVTVADLLTHRSGLEVRDPLPSDIHSDFDRVVTMEEYIADRMPPVVREPGTAYLYENFGYLLLGYLVQEVSGEPYEEYMAKHIFEPLGMDDSSFVLTDELFERLVTGYDATYQAVEPYVIDPTIMPHGGMLSTAEDLSKFMIAMLNGGALDPEDEATRILSEESVAEMTVYRSKIHPLMPNTTYGFEALMQLPLAGANEAIITKAGNVPGVSSLLILLPEDGVGVFLTYNLETTLRDVFYMQFLQTFFPQYAQPAELEPFEPTPAEELAVLAGYYTDLRLSQLTSKVDVLGDGTLMIADGIIGPRQLTQVDEYLFVDELAHYYTAFVIDETSGRAYMKEPYLNPLGYARQGEAPQGFVDVTPDNHYAQYIYALQSIGIYPNDGTLSFAPEEGLTRAELVYDLLRISGLHPEEATEFAFADIEGHPFADYIQYAHVMGMVSGDDQGNFHPDRVATRQEAATMLWNVYSQLYPAELFADVELIGEVAPWAEPAVKMAITFGYVGWEMLISEDGAYDYQATEVLTRQEAAALYHQLFFVPTEQIVAQLMQQQQAAEQAEQQELPAEAVAPEAEVEEPAADEAEAVEADGEESAEAA